MMKGGHGPTKQLQDLIGMHSTMYLICTTIKVLQLLATYHYSIYVQMAHVHAMSFSKHIIRTSIYEILSVLILLYCERHINGAI